VHLFRTVSTKESAHNRSSIQFYFLLNGLEVLVLRFYTGLT